MAGEGAEAQSFVNVVKFRSMASAFHSMYVTLGMPMYRLIRVPPHPCTALQAYERELEQLHADVAVARSGEADAARRLAAAELDLAAARRMAAESRVVTGGARGAVEGGPGNASRLSPERPFIHPVDGGRES